MSNSKPQRRSSRLLRDVQIPNGETIATFDSYVAAQQAVASLARADFPVKQVSIIGSDLKTVERVTGKVSYARAAGAGALSGAWLGLFFGLLLVIINPQSNLTFVAAAILMGAAFGMLFMIVSFSINRGRPDFTSVKQVVATRYAIVVPGDTAARARTLIGASGNSTSDGPGPESA